MLITQTHTSTVSVISIEMEERNSITTGHKVKGINDCHYEDGWTDVCGRRCVKQNDCRFVAWLLQVVIQHTNRTCCYCVVCLHNELL